MKLLKLSLSIFLYYGTHRAAASSSSTPGVQIPSSASAPSDTNSDNNDLAASTLASQRAEYVRSVLTNRLQYVLKGKRTRDFAKFVMEQKGEMTIFSMHGLETQEVDPETLDPGHRLNKPGLLNPKNPRDPFPTDRLLLDLVNPPNAPPNLYRGVNINSVDIQPPSIFQLATRAIQLGIHFFPVLSTLIFAIFIPSFRQNVWYRWLASCIGSAGAAWIKWGQWSSTRNDMFPDALCNQLATLHSDAPAHSWKYSEQSLECSLGLAPGTLMQVFDEFEKEPIASGSIAQVHRAKLGNQFVAVKIRHPRVAELIDLDFRLMSFAAAVADYIPSLSWLRIRDSVSQFSHTMAAQAYLNVEGHHLEVLNHNFRRWPHVRFPQPFYAGSSIILETFEPGRISTGVIQSYEDLAMKLNEQSKTKVQVEEPVEDGDEDVVLSKHDENEYSSRALVPVEERKLDGIDVMPISLARFLVTTGTSLYLKMLLVDNLMHADLHPGT